MRFTFDVNTLAHYWVAKAFLPNIVKRNHGMVVTVSSAAAWLSLPGITDYSSSKAAALSFHEGLTGELKFRYNAPRVRTVSVHPGHSKTALFTGFNQGSPFFMPSLYPETVAEAIVKQVLTGRSGNVILPETASLLSMIRAMPDWFFMSNIKNAQGAMKNWSGRQVIENVGAAPTQGSESQTTEGGESTVLVSSQ